jgi:hypothetical protein
VLCHGRASATCLALQAEKISNHVDCLLLNSRFFYPVWNKLFSIWKRNGLFSKR